MQRHEAYIMAAILLEDKIEQVDWDIRHEMFTPQDEIEVRQYMRDMGEALEWFKAELESLTSSVEVEAPRKDIYGPDGRLLGSINDLRLVIRESSTGEMPSSS